LGPILQATLERLAPRQGAFAEFRHNQAPMLSWLPASAPFNAFGDRSTAIDRTVQRTPHKLALWSRESGD